MLTPFAMTMPSQCFVADDFGVSNENDECFDMKSLR